MIITYTIRLPARLIVSANVEIGFKGTNDHARLQHLDFASSGHTGFASSEELNDYAKKEELATELTEEDIDNIIGG